MAWLTPGRYAAELVSESARLAAAAARLQPGATVESCPEWTVRDLVTHVGTGHRLAAGIIEERRDSMAPYHLIDAPDDRAEWPAWLAAGAERLNAAVDDLGFDGTVWTWQPKHQTAGFWLRRMVHDEIIHRFDAEPGGDLAPDLAADGIADMLLTLGYFKAVKGTGSLLFTATDTGESWHVTLAPDGITWAAVARQADVTCRAPVKDLLLILNRRREPASLDGDKALFELWWEGSRF